MMTLPVGPVAERIRSNSMLVTTLLVDAVTQFLFGMGIVFVETCGDDDASHFDPLLSRFYHIVDGFRLAEFFADPASETFATVETTLCFFHGGLLR